MDINFHFEFGNVRHVIGCIMIAVASGGVRKHMEGMATLTKMLWLGIKFTDYSLVLDQFISRPSNPLTCPSGFLDLDLGNILKSWGMLAEFFFSMNKDKNKSHIQYKSFIHFPHDAVFGAAVIYREWWSTHSAFCIIGPISVSCIHITGALCHITLLLEFKPK